MNIAQDTAVVYIAGMFVPVAMVLVASLSVVMLRRWLRRLRAESPVACFMRPVYRSACVFLLISALYALVRAYALLSGATLPESGLHITLVLSISLVLLAIPYRWIDIAVDYGRRFPDKRYVWPEYARIYRTPARIALFAVFALIALETTGFDIKALLLAGGIGGLIAGLALKELLSDFFSGLSLHATPLLKPGDVVRLCDRNIEGTITDIGFRMTRLMTFERRPLLLPNSFITSSIIEHLSHIKSRRIQFVIGVRYDDYGAVENIVKDLRAEIPERPSMVDQQSSLVFFREFGAHSLDILIRVFTRKTDYRDYCMELEQVLHHTAAIVQRNGAEFAFPTSVVHLQEDSSRPDAPDIRPPLPPL